MNFLRVISGFLIKLLLQSIVWMRAVARNQVLPSTGNTSEGFRGQKAKK